MNAGKGPWKGCKRLPARWISGSYWIFFLMFPGRTRVEVSAWFELASFISSCLVLCCPQGMNLSVVCFTVTSSAGAWSASLCVASCQLPKPVVMRSGLKLWQVQTSLASWGQVWRWAVDTAFWFNFCLAGGGRTRSNVRVCLTFTLALGYPGSAWTSEFVPQVTCQQSLFHKSPVTSHTMQLISTSIYWVLASVKSFPSDLSLIGLKHDWKLYV